MRVLVTGAGGFVGRHLTRRLLARGTLAGTGGASAALRELVLVDRTPVEPPPGPTGVGITVMAGDLRDDGFLAAAIGAGVDSIFHLAATLTVAADCDLDTGWAVNLQLPRSEAGREGNGCVSTGRSGGWPA